MLGVEMEPDYRRRGARAGAARSALLEVKGLAGTYLRDTTFTLHEGEVLGIAGLPDSGRDELPRLLTDRPEHATAGRVRLDADAEWTDIGDWKADARRAPAARPGPRGHRRRR